MLYLLLLVLPVGSNTGLLSQEGLSFPKVHAFTTNTYGGGNQNWDITQDGSGILYVANTTGVLRYDGINWSTLPLPGTPTVRSVAVAGNRLYAGGYGEFGYFEAPTDEVPVWKTLSGALNGPDRNEEIWNIEVLADGTVAFQSFGRLFAYDGVSLQTIIPPGVMMFAEAWGDELVVPVTGQGLFRWSKPNGFSLLAGTAVLGDQEVVSIVPWGNGLLLSNADGILWWENDTLRTWSSLLDAQLSDREINRLQVLEDGSLAIGTITSGLYIYDPVQETLLHLDEATALSNNTVLSLFQSAAGNLWVGLDRGLDLVDRSRAISYPAGADRPPGSVYAAVRYAGRNYLGTNQGLYWRDSLDAEPAYRLVAGTAGQVWELRQTEKGLLCGHNEGTFLVQDTTSRLISGRSGGWQTLVLDDGSGRLLQATYTGLQLLTPAEAGFTVVDLPGFSAPVRNIGQVGARDFLVLHGSRGGYVVRLSDDYQSITGIDTLAQTLVKSGMVAFDDTLLVQSQEAIHHFHAGELVRLSSFRGVPLEPGNYCLSGRPGSGEWFLYEPDRVRVYRGRELLTELPLRLRYPYPVIIPWADNKYLFLLEEGFAEVKISQEQQWVPELLLQSSCRIDSGWQMLQIVGETPPELAYAKNDLRFVYALPIFDRKVKYRSRLVGYAAEDWSGWSALGEREFTSLPAGKYRFEVEANWFGVRAERTFLVLPPWYQSKVAYLLYALSLTLIGWQLYRLHLKRLARQARQLEVVRQRELQRERILARNRELKLDIRRKSRELANTTLTLAKKNEILLALKEELAKGRNNPAAGIDHRKVGKLIDRNLNNEEDWAIFESHFNEVHEAFLKRLRKKHPELTNGDLKLAAYLRMDLSSKEIAPLMHISLRGVENKRYRLRKKLGLEGDDNLNLYLLEF